MMTTAMTTTAITATTTMTDLPSTAPGSAGSRPQVLASLRGIRGRVVLSYVLLVAAALAVSLVLIRTALLAQESARIDDSLVQEAEELRRAAEGLNPATGEPFGTDAAALFDAFLATSVLDSQEVVLSIVGGEPYKETLGAPVELAGDEALVRRWSSLREPLRLNVGSGADEARTLAVPLLDDADQPVGTFVVAIFPAERIHEVNSVVRTVALVGLVVLAAAAAVALALARQVLRPVDELGATARRISDNDLSARFADDGSDELADLGRTFNAMLDRLEAGFGAQRDVLDDVAHELRTPITIVQGHLELLELDSGADAGERSDTVALCLDELDRMGRYVEELLQVAAATRPDFLSLGLVDVGELAEGLEARVRAMADRQWSVVDAPAPGSLLIEADAQRLTQAVTNLVGNAVQHTEDGDPIELVLAASDTTVTISVVDHGPGVAPDVRDHLFNRFSRAAGSRSNRPDGTGLGLTIVAAIAEAHGGSVTATDTAGGGATFVLSLPRPTDFDQEVLP